MKKQVLVRRYAGDELPACLAECHSMLQEDANTVRACSMWSNVLLLNPVALSPTTLAPASISSTMSEVLKLISNFIAWATRPVVHDNAELNIADLRMNELLALSLVNQVHTQGDESCGVDFFGVHEPSRVGKMASTSLRKQMTALRQASSGTSSGYLQRKKGKPSLLLTPEQVSRGAQKNTRCHVMARATIMERHRFSGKKRGVRI